MATQLVERDSFTMRHMNKWLDSQVGGDACREECQAAMLAIYDDDPEYWMSQSWPNLFDRAKCWDIVRKFM